MFLLWNISKMCNFDFMSCISEKFSKLLVFFSCHVYEHKFHHLHCICVLFLCLMCGVCDCCSRLTEGEVGWVWQSWLCVVGDIFGEWEEKEGKKKWSLSSYGMKRKSRGLGLNDVDWVLELLDRFICFGWVHPQRELGLFVFQSELLVWFYKILSVIWL